MSNMYLISGLKNEPDDYVGTLANDQIHRVHVHIVTYTLFQTMYLVGN